MAQADYDRPPPATSAPTAPYEHTSVAYVRFPRRQLNLLKQCQLQVRLNKAFLWSDADARAVCTRGEAFSEEPRESGNAASRACVHTQQVLLENVGIAQALQAMNRSGERAQWLATEPLTWLPRQFGQPLGRRLDTQ